MSTENPLPKTYGPKCGGKTPQEDSFNCQQQQNKAQTNLRGGGNCQVTVPQSEGGVDNNSPHNNASNTKQLTAGLNQSRESAKYDNVGNRNVDNSAGPGGGGRRKKSKKRKMKTKFTRKKKTSQKSRRRKIYVGCKGRKRLGGKTKKLSGLGCMSGGKKKTKKRKTKKGGNILSNLKFTNPFVNKKELSDEPKKRPAVYGNENRPENLTKEEIEEFNTNINTGNKPRETYYGPIYGKNDDNIRDATTQRPSKLTKEEEEKFKNRKDVTINESKNTIHSGGKRKTRKFKKHYMWNTKGKRYMAKTYKQHLRGKKLGHTHTKPKRKSKKTRKTRKTRRRGGDMRPGSPEHTAELERRKKDRAQGLNVREEADKRLEADKRKKEERMENQRTIMRTMAGMEQQKIEASKRHSVPNMPTTSNNFSPVRDRARTMG